MSLEQAKAGVSGRFTLDKSAVDPSGIYRQWLKGEVSGQATQEIVLEFCEDQLRTAVVIFAENDKRPMRSRWHQLVDPLIGQWGPPKKLLEPMPAQPPKTSEDPQRDLDTIASGGGLIALWELAHEVKVGVNTMPKASDAEDHTRMELAWMAFDYGSGKSCFRAHAPQPEGAE